MAYRGYDNPAGTLETTSPTHPICRLRRWTGTAFAVATTGAYGNKYTLFLQNTVGARSDPFLTAMDDDAYSWYTFDFYPGAMALEAEWLIAANGRAVSTGMALVGLCLQRDTPSGGSYKAKLVTFNYDGGLVPENYADVADSGAFEFPQLTRMRVNIRQRYNSGANTVDIEVWVNGVQEIAAAGIAVPAGKSWVEASYAYWAPQQFERAVGKGGVDFDAYWCNFIWNDEGAGIGPTGRPSANYVVVMHQFEADTDDAARDDWTKGGTANLKYQHVDDNNTLKAEDTHIYVGQSTVDEQELALKNHLQKSGGTASIDSICVYGEFTRSSDYLGKPAEVEVALHCSTGAAWTPTILNSIFGIVRRKTLTVGENLRCWNLYIMALGEDIETPAANPNSDNADQTPAGDVTSFKPMDFVGYDPQVFTAYFDAPPAPPGGYPHSQVVMTT